MGEERSREPGQPAAAAAAKAKIREEEEQAEQKRLDQRLQAEFRPKKVRAEKYNECY